MQNHFGEIAGVLTAVFWTVTSLAFESAGKKVGSLSVNLIRLVMAFFFIGIYSWIARGFFFPTDATLFQWKWLAVSGLVGFVIGDLLLFQAFVVVGARISMLMMALAPPFAAFIGWLILGRSYVTDESAGNGNYFDRNCNCNFKTRKNRRKRDSGQKE